MFMNEHHMYYDGSWGLRERFAGALIVGKRASHHGDRKSVRKIESAVCDAPGLLSEESVSKNERFSYNPRATHMPRLPIYRMS